MYAHYFASKKTKHVLITLTNRPTGGERIEVKGKAEARKVAAQHGAKAWNF
tara:strand:- start:8949 stop:9101 length:153 start_codon:yes stop_codon:yes gene_type:complete